MTKQRKEGLQPLQAQPSISGTTLSAHPKGQVARAYPEHGSKANWSGLATVVLASIGPHHDYPALTIPFADAVGASLKTDGLIRTARSLAEPYAALRGPAATIGEALALFDSTQHVGIVVHDGSHGTLYVPVVNDSFLAFDFARSGATP